MSKLTKIIALSALVAFAFFSGIYAQTTGEKEQSKLATRAQVDSILATAPAFNEMKVSEAIPAEWGTLVSVDMGTAYFSAKDGTIRACGIIGRPVKDAGKLTGEVHIGTSEEWGYQRVALVYIRGK